MPVPEPVSGLATAIGLLGFIITTLLNTIERSKLAYECLQTHERRVNAYRIALHECELQLRVWYAKWEPIGEASALRSGQELWGATGLRHIQAIKEQITQGQEELKRRIYGAVDAPDSQIWRALLDHVPGSSRGRAAHLTDTMTNPECQQTTPGVVPIRRLCQKAAFVLWRNGSLKDSVPSLKALVSSLESTATALLFSQHGYHRAGSTLNADILLGIAQESVRRRTVTNALRLAYERLNGERGSTEWTLVGEMPPMCSGGNESRLESLSETLSIAFLKLERLFETNGTARWVESSIAIDMPESADAYPESIIEKERQSRERATTATLLHSVKEIFLLISAVPGEYLELEDMTISIDDLKEQFAKVLQARRLKTALSLASSVALYGDTPWMDKLCGCSVRHAQMDCYTDAGEDGVVQDHTLVAIGHQNAPTSMRCYHSQPGWSRGLLLAVILVELGIARPVQIERDAEDRRLRYYIVDSGAREPVEAADLIRRAGHCTRSRYYRQAVEHCFWLAENLIVFESESQRRNDFEHKVVQKLALSYRSHERVMQQERQYPWRKEDSDYWKKCYKNYIDTAQRLLRDLVSDKPGAAAVSM